MNIECRLQSHRIPLTGYITVCLLLLSLMITQATLVQAATDDVALESQGFGSTYQEALNSALLTGVQQVRGLEAGTMKGVRFDLNAIVAADTFLQVDGKLAQTVDTYTHSRGWVKSYRVLDVKKPADKDDAWQVTIKAIIPMYPQAIPDDKRQSIAVFQFRIDSTIVAVDNSRASPSKISQQLANAIQSALVRSQHYAVLNRNFESELNREHQLWASGAVNPTEASRLGEQLGADFMLLGQIDHFTINHRKKEFYNVDFGGQRAEIEVSYQMIESATGKIIWSDQKRWFKVINENQNRFTRDDAPHPLADVIILLGNEIAVDLLATMAPSSAVATTPNTPASKKAMQQDRPLTPGSNDKPISW